MDNPNITTLPEAYKPLADYRQFILWKSVPQPGGKVKKLPVDYRSLQPFKKGDDWQNSPNCWTDAANAIALAKLCGNDIGVGFFFTANDPFFFLDIDNCLLPDNVTWSETALTVLSHLPWSLVEVSQSGRGLHIIGSYTGTMPDHGCKNVSLGLELYSEKRFVAFSTGLLA